MKVGLETVKKACLRIAEKIKRSGFKPEILLVIAKGGLIGGYFLAKKLGIKEVVVINLQSYKGRNCGTLVDNTTVLDTEEFMKKDNILIFDDLADSGATLLESLKYIGTFKKIRVATMYAKEGSAITPNYCYKKVSSKVRIDFTYEQI